LNPWKGSDTAKSFYRARVSAIAEDEGAVAAVNGSFFSYSGRPLGTLLIDKEMVSSPIYGRTAFLISDDQKAYIDNITLDCYFLTINQVCYKITGINQSRDNNSIILYTPLWGKKTGTATNGIELIVSKGIVKEIKAGNSNIPQDGYVISFIGTESQFVSDNIKVGEPLDLKINIVPFATSPNGVTHIVSGGPRLVKQGSIYVSKHEERFKADVGSARAARTAIGITRDGSILNAAVDGRPRKKKLRNDNSSLGMTLEELAGLMRKLGAYDAMNLDGGSSSTMWAKDKLLNIPVTGYEAGVSNAIVLRPKI
jgi:exopolysaccharide biosynthesis protein